MTQGVPVVTTASDGSPVLYFEYRMLLPNGATVFLLQTVVASLFQQTGPGIPSFLVASNNLKVREEIIGETNAFFFFLVHQLVVLGIV